MEQPKADFKEKIVSIIESRKYPKNEGESETEIENAVEGLRKEVKNFLNGAKDKKDRALREGVLTDVIIKVSEESGVGVLDVAKILFPEKEKFFDERLSEKDTKEGEFLVNLKRLDIAQHRPMDVLTNIDKFANEPYAEMMIDMAAQQRPDVALANSREFATQKYAEAIIMKAAKKNPVVALDYLDRYIKQPYGEKILKMLVEKKPENTLHAIAVYEKQPFASQIVRRAVELATERNPGYVLTYIKGNKMPEALKKDFTEKAYRNLAEKDPTKLLSHDSMWDLGKKPYGAEVKELAYRGSAKNKPAATLYVLDGIKGEPYFEEVTEIVMKNLKDPKLVLEYSYLCVGSNYGESVIRKAAEESPRSALRFWRNFRNQSYYDDVIRKAAATDPSGARYYGHIK